MMIKAIETQYKGYRFRSRLEARWAVFFDALGLDWEYEPEGYCISKYGCYLPDFFISTLGCFVEVKPKIEEGDYWHIIDKLTRFHQESDHFVLLLVGPPGDEFYKPLSNQSKLFCADLTDSSGGSIDASFVFATKINGNKVYILPDTVGDGMREREHFSSLSCEGGERIIDMPDGRKAPKFYTGINIIKAAKKARSARFEHGESP